MALSLAYIDWASHLAAAPQRQMEVVKDAILEAAYQAGGIGYYGFAYQPGLIPVNTSVPMLPPLP